MPKEVQIKVISNFVKKYKSGFPLITSDALINGQVLKEEGTIIKLTDEKGNFIGKGYYGKQNKGLGWILTNKEDQPFNQAFFVTKITNALNHRKQLFADPNTTAFRIFNGEGDGVGGITIDYFDRFYLINWYSIGIYQFRNVILDALKEVVDYKGIYQKKRFDAKGRYVEDDDFVTGERGEFPLIVKENGVHFAIYLNEGAMVGVFLDQREVRKTIQEKYAKGTNMLNTFSYTGAFSVFAALGGAIKTTSVDLANRSKAKTIEQFQLNGIDHEAQDIIVEDVFHYFKYAGRKNLKFDLVVLDPPSFARSKKVVFSAEKDYTNLLKETIAITSENGVIVASTNSSAFGMKKFKGFIQKAFEETGESYRILEEFSLPSDFRTIKEYPQGNYLKVVFIKKG
ncbi:class I SAM-dependent rRNA methyltransferase [Salirhabdus sp. Marseille-P4669]|uniref:class I SAM-dependent rRNA methyltransferase n=1 Tax=Salirhabdus sp. Marseille-P4669 TaxID=2042310 RepID=UPI000C7C70C4|nr:class I SAM-dependent rRNA methyltransferase [Salirhabdus sp. Marseille-P4669]